MLLLALVLNWMGASLLLAPQERVPVSYAFFREQVEAGIARESAAPPPVGAPTAHPAG
ncbi:MAG: hypothetical protein ACOYXW_08240 [Actinomycetota bacterium]